MSPSAQVSAYLLSVVAPINSNEVHLVWAGKNKVAAETTELKKRLGGRREGEKETGLFDAFSHSHPRNAQKLTAESEMHLGQLFCLTLHISWVY